MHKNSTFSQELFDAICNQVGEGCSVRSVCSAPGMPSKSTFFLWIRSDQTGELSAQYVRAKDARAQVFFDDIAHATDHAKQEYVDQEEEGPFTAGELMQAAKIKADNLKWILSRMDKKYADTTIHKGDAEDPVQMNTTVDLSKYSIDDLRKLAAAADQADPK